MPAATGSALRGGSAWLLTPARSVECNRKSVHENRAVYTKSACNKYALVDWVGEESYSVVPCLSINHGVYSIGTVENVTTGQGVFKGVMFRK